jgi:hypothetical protein
MNGTLRRSILCSLLIAGCYLKCVLYATGAEETKPAPTLKEVSELKAASMADLSLEEIDQQLNNPLTSLWSLTLQENFSLITGDNVNGTTEANTLFFQPAFPIPFGKDKVFIARPVFPMVTVPNIDASGDIDGHDTGFGDMQLFALLGPDRAEGLVWGVGSTFIFPTANGDLLGAGQWQAGPAAMVLNLGKKWSTGIIAQHWWSFAGDDDRSSRNHTDIQYIIRRKIPGAMSIGMGPTVSIDWNADRDNRVSFPIGLGITKTVRIGKIPFKLRFEPQYSIIKPDAVGTEWNFRIQISPVIPSPFSR